MGQTDNRTGTVRAEIVGDPHIRISMSLHDAANLLVLLRLRDSLSRVMRNGGWTEDQIDMLMGIASRTASALENMDLPIAPVWDPAIATEFRTRRISSAYDVGTPEGVRGARQRGWW